MRARNIKPAFFINPELAELPFEFRLLFIGLWTLADREGRLEDKPKKIRMAVFPGDDVDCAAGLMALADAGFIHRYTVDGQALIQILTWHKHQKPHQHEKPSSLPEAGPESTAKDEAEHNQGVSEAQPRCIHDTTLAMACPADSLIADSGLLIADSGLRIVAAKRATPIPPDFAISDRVERWAEDKGHTNLPAYLEFFVGRMRAGGKKYLDWDEALMNCIREDWPGIRKQGAPPGVTRKEAEAKDFIRRLKGDGRGQTIDGVVTDRLDRKTV